MRKLLKFCAMYLLVFMGGRDVWAAEIRPYIVDSGNLRWIVIEGTIKQGDYDAFIKIVRENQGKIYGVYLFTPGGDFYEAMKIGRAMRALELASFAPMRNTYGEPICVENLVTPLPKNPKNCTCASAGFFIHIGAVHRGGTYLSVHRPYFGTEKFGELSHSKAKLAFDHLQDSARDYMREMGVPDHIQEDVLGTPSDRALVLDDKTVKTYFWLELPYRHEWIKNRCRPFSEDEETKLNEYKKRRLSSLLSKNKNTFTNVDLEKYEALIAKKRDASSCPIEIDKKLRNEAYEKFFGEKPSDTVGYDFEKWAVSKNYLGKRFHEISENEKFEEVRILKEKHLSRNATAKGPSISLYGSKDQADLVSSIILVSDKNPSIEFKQALLKALENAWGKCAGDNDSVCRWQGEDFSATLKYEHNSEPFLGLFIDSK